MYNGRWSYRRLDGAYFIWWHTALGIWYISTAVGVQGADYWSNATNDMLGVYSPEGTATGDATVAEGSHL